MNLKERARQCYYDQLKRCNNHNHPGFKWYGAKGVRVEYLLEEFREWYLINAKGFNCPTIDRKDHSGNYCFENIQIVEKSDNSKERMARVGTPLKKRPVAIISITDRSVIGVFESAYHAARFISGSVGSINHVLSGRRLTHKGYSFKHME